ncbi:hypothetical protein J0895_21580 [Phormidium pseudopriestleyi FRX01]|uniref:Uncharacterized protein n=1 Tax=Phormidium pseudopriestleyi FRX01 TaxID=1759528 RepID=A0ABS3FYE3_9CYAN|nr:hypothetical protein [Phormidium pseudopriestleyi]MBO0351626.1 hypothetical protein [Phormidium pseudopriestleyi FRX01]
MAETLYPRYFLVLKFLGDRLLDGHKSPQFHPTTLNIPQRFLSDVRNLLPLNPEQVTMEKQGKCWKQETGTALDLWAFPVVERSERLPRESGQFMSCLGYSLADIANISQVLNLNRQLPLHSLSIPAKLSVKVRLASALN